MVKWDSNLGSLVMEGTTMSYLIHQCFFGDLARNGDGNSTPIIN